MRTLRFFVVAGVLSLGFSAHAGPKATELLKECTRLQKELTLQQELGLTPKKWKLTKEALASDNYCVGFVDGVVDGYRIMTELYPQTRFICLPVAGIINDQAIEIFEKWIKKNTKDKNLPARSAILLSLRDAYPCGK